MSVLKRISELISANINHLLDQAENPEVMIKQIIRDMETNIIKLRSETVRAVARQKQLEKQIDAAGRLAQDLEKQAKMALDKNDQDHARQILEKKIASQERRDFLREGLQEATETVTKLKADLVKLEDQVQEARRKKENLIRRKRAAEAKMRSQDSVSKAKSALGTASKAITNLTESQKNLQSYEEAISNLEAEVEAANQTLETEKDPKEELEKQAREEAVEKELERLKRSTKKR